MRKILCILMILALTFLAGTSVIAEENGTEFHFVAKSKVFDYHDSIYAVVIELDREVKTAALTTRTFTVHATSIDNQHGNAEVYFDGNRTITDIYASKSGVPGDRADSGSFIVIELLNGANVAEAVICPYFDTTYYQSALLDVEYTITQNGDVGNALPLDAGASYVFDGLRTETVDEFAYGGDYGVSYRLFTPETSNAEKYPLVVWLHGFGERGTDNETTLRSNRGGVAWAEETVQRDHPCFVMSAQASSNRAWAVNGQEDMIDALIRNIKDVCAANPQIDTNRIYVSGVSSGGGGTWQALLRAPDLFAAAIPLAPAYTVVGDDGFITDAAKAELATLADMPIWIIHGDGDPTVDINKTSNPTYIYLTEVIGNPNVLFTKIKDTSYAGRNHYTLHNVEVRVFNFDLVFDTSYSAANRSGDISIPAEKNDSELTPVEWLFAQSK